MRIIFVLFLFVFIQSADIYDPTHIYNAIMVNLKAEMPEKTKWDNSDYYEWEVKVWADLLYLHMGEKDVLVLQ